MNGQQLLEDLDLDGHLEMLIGCNDTWIYCWDLGEDTFDPDLMPWPQWRHEAQKTATVPVGDASAITGTVEPWVLVATQASPNPFKNKVRRRHHGKSRANAESFGRAGTMPGGRSSMASISTSLSLVTNTGAGT